MKRTQSYHSTQMCSQISPPPYTIHSIQGMREQKKNALLSDLSELGEIRLAQPHRHTNVEAHAKVAEEP